jgi:hypothetical protein
VTAIAPAYDRWTTSTSTPGLTADPTWEASAGGPADDEAVGIGVGLALLWERLTGRRSPAPDRLGSPAGTGLLLVVFGLIAVIVGIQGLFAPDA